TLYGHEEPIICLDFDKLYGTLVTSAYDSTVRVWDLAMYKCLGALEGHSGRKSASITDPQTLSSHPDRVRCIQLTDKRLLTGSDDWSIKQWDLSLLPPSRSRSPSLSSTASTMSTPLGSPTASSFDQRPLETLRGCDVGTFDGHNGEVTCIYADEKHLVSGASDRTMKQWDLETCQCVLTLDIMWAMGGTKAANVWAASDMQLDAWANESGEVGEFVGALQFWNFALASGTVDGTIRMWDCE
ncbi:WD40-repeat-containing domain protein, partial [Jimgerdemannia flammicorona]